MTGKDHCSICLTAVDPHAVDTWKEVNGWVGGPRRDSMKLRTDTGYYAHDKCIAKVTGGQPADQPSLIGDDPGKPIMVEPIPEEDMP